MSTQPVPRLLPDADSRALANGGPLAAAAAAAPALYREPLTPPYGCDDDGYPFEDSTPLPSTTHEDVRDYVKNALRDHHGERLFVAVELGLLYRRGDPGGVVMPDVMAVFGAEHRPRLSYRLWEEPQRPCFALEVLSERTWRVDVGPKRATYEALGIQEYWLFDPLDRHMHPPLQGLALHGGRYRAVRSVDGRLRSEALGLEFERTADGLLRLRDPATGKHLRSHAEVVADEKAEAARRRAAEDRLAASESRLVASESRLATSESLNATYAARIAELEAQLRGRE